MTVKNFPERLRLVAQTLHVDHQIIAKACNVSKATFSNYLHGKKLPRMETLAGLIAEYGISADWLIAGHGSMFLEKRENQRIEGRLADSDDPIVERMRAAAHLLKEANAPDGVIQNAILAVLAAKDSAE